MTLVMNPAQQRAIQGACAYADRRTDPATGLVGSEHGDAYRERESIYSAIACLLSGEPDRVARATTLFAAFDVLRDRFSICAGLLVLLKAPELLNEAMRHTILRSVEAFMDTEAEDIIAGRNNNLPLQTWTVRIAGGVFFKRADLIARGIAALEQLTDLVAAHGTIPEFNSGTYHPVTLQMLRVIVLLGEPRTSALASAIELHLWREMALRFHPRLGQLCGPWSRAYHDSLCGGNSNALLLADVVWGAFYDGEIGYRYDHGSDYNYGGVLALLGDRHPVDAREAALDKTYPTTVVSAAEQVDFRTGDVWAPGGVAEITTWMDEHLSVGTATRSHVHAMQNATYVAQWTRTGEAVKQLRDLGQAFTRFIQNGRRPGQPSYKYRNHHRGETLVMNGCLWADDGRPFALQSANTALILYVPKGQERKYVQSLEMMAVVPRLDTVDAVLVNGSPVDVFKGPAWSTVVVRSGCASLGLRFAPCSPCETEPRLVVERRNDHLLVGLRLAAFTHERELPESEYRRYAGSIGAELRYTPTDDAVEKLVSDMDTSELLDTWWAGESPVAFGGPRCVRFAVGGAVLSGRFAPVAETWLARRTPPPEGRCVRIEFPR